MKQSVRYLTSGDGTRLAWSCIGNGVPLIKAAHWLSHLEYELESPLWRHWLHFLGDHFRLIRYDERGCGMTGGGAHGLSLTHWLADLEAVIEASGVEPPFALMGISQGAAACIAYAAKYPERVSDLVLYGGYARGAFRRGNAEGASMYRAIVDIARGGWDAENPVFRQLFTARFIPGGTELQVHWFNELARMTTTAAAAGALLEARASVDVTDLLPRVTARTLVLHAREDGVVPLEEGRLLAAGITGAEFVELESRNHILLEAEPAWSRFREEVLRFFGRDASASLAGLTTREREIVQGLLAGRSNAEIAASLCISDKTVRNALTRIFEKLGVRSRTQAMAFLRQDRTAQR